MYSETRISSKELHSRKNLLWTIYIMLISIKQQQPLWLKMSRISDLETDVPSQDVNCTNRHEKLRWFLIMSMVFRLKSRVQWLQWKRCQKMIVSKRANSFNIQSWWQLKKKRNWNDTITYKINLIKSVRFLEEMLQLRNATLRTIFRWLKPVAQFTKPKWQIQRKSKDN